jgi:hypothetical protein
MAKQTAQVDPSKQVDLKRPCASLRMRARSLDQEIAWPDLPPEIQDRDADVWEPLIAVADAIGGEWPQRAACNGCNACNACQGYGGEPGRAAPPRSASPLR